MKTYWIYILFALCLTILPDPCTGSPSSEALYEAVQGVVAITSPEPPLLGDGSNEGVGSVESLASFHPGETSISIGENDGPIQVALANIPPKPSKSEEAVEIIADPLEPVNRAFFHFNDKLYFWVFKPAATGYKAIIPEDGRVGVHNFFSNLTTPVRLVNCLLQADPKCAGTETERFFLNTTIGLAGFLDPAKKKFKIEKRDKDFGQTLGVWGIGPAFYIDWPILGPSSLRDTVGYVGDLSLDPRTYLPARLLFVEMGVWVLDKVNGVSLTIGEYEDLKNAAIDPYIALRDAYYQYRQNKIIASKLRNGSPNANKIDNSKQSTEFKESGKAEVITETPPLEPEMKKTEQIPSNVEGKLSSSVRDKKIVTVTWTFVIIRSGARNDYPIVTTVNQGDKLIITGESGEWFHVRLENGQQGWVSNKVVK